METNKLPTSIFMQNKVYLDDFKNMIEVSKLNK